MGSGGAGHADNSQFYSFTASGAAGGGIAIIITDSLLMNGNPIFAGGGTGPYCYSPDCSDGMGGGGGCVLLMADKIVDTITIYNQGGDGAFVKSPVSPGGRVGPGGGGGGGVTFLSATALPNNTALVNNGGANGFIALDAFNPWGATKGADGLNFLNLSLPFDTVLFKPNIDSVKISDSLLNCNSFKFSGQAFVNTYPATSWQWNFGDGNQAFIQNTSHTYTTENTYTAKLIATDINGCKDSTANTVNPKIVSVDAGANKTICSNSSVAVILNGTGTGVYAWTPASFLNDSTLKNPIATINTTTTFYLTFTYNNCPAKDSVKIIVSPVPEISISKSNDVNCYLPYTKLKATWHYSICGVRHLR